MNAALARFPKAYLALYSAMQSRDITLPLSPGHSMVAVSTDDRVAVFKQNADIQSGAYEIWSARDKKVVASPGVAKVVPERIWNVAAASTIISGQCGQSLKATPSRGSAASDF